MATPATNTTAKAANQILLRTNFITSPVSIPRRSENLKLLTVIETLFPFFGGKESVNRSKVL
jgi:hypothetical protein